LLKHRPDLYLWETDYGNNVNRNTLPTLRPSIPGDTRFGLDPSSPDLVIKGFSVVPTAPLKAWVAWPLWRQFEGNNQGAIPRSAVGDLTPLRNWDFNSSLVRDPSDSVATPRLKLFAIDNIAYLARLDDIEPQYNTRTGAHNLPRRGRLRVYPSPFRTPVEITSDSNWILGPSSPIIVLTQNTPELLVLSTLTEFGSSTLSTRGWTPIEHLWQQCIYPGIRFPFAFDGCQLGGEKHLFYATTSGQVYSSRRKGTGPWGDRQAAGDTLRIHPFGMLAACTRGNAVHTLTFDASSNLVALEWHVQEKVWPAKSFSVVSNESIIPSSVAVVSPSPSEVIAVVVGSDMRPWRYVYRITVQGSSWSTGVPLGRDTDMVLPHARLSLSVVDTQTLDLIATGSDGTPQRYTMTRNNDWGTSSRTPILTPVQAGGPLTTFLLPNPHGDISSLKLSSFAAPLVTFCGVGPGTVAALLSLTTGNAIRLLD
jgi:hypothetical protein